MSQQKDIDALIEDLYPGTPRHGSGVWGSGVLSRSSSISSMHSVTTENDGNGARSKTQTEAQIKVLSSPPPETKEKETPLGNLTPSPPRKIKKLPPPDGAWTWPRFLKSPLAPPKDLETSGEEICVINTGGTFSCLIDDDNKLSPKPLFPDITKMEAFAEGRLIPEKQRVDASTDDLARCKFVLVEHETLMIDSTNITANEWNLMAMVLASRRDYYKAFVVIHGTDTMAYSGSVLTFALPNLGKPVVITGSQNPLRYVRKGVHGHTDAANNLLGAIQYADLEKAINTVVIYFNSKIILGTRAVKGNAVNFDAFTSPNVGVLGYFNGEFRINDDLADYVNQMSFNETMNRQKLNPPPKFGMLPFFLRARVLMYQTMPASMPSEAHLPLQGMLGGLIEDRSTPVAVIALGYGAGNGQPEVAEYLREIREEHFIPCVWTTQCFAGTSQGNYAVGMGSDQGVNVWDMTPECAYVRLLHTLSQRLYLGGKFERNEEFRNMVEDIMRQPGKLCFTPPDPKSEVMKALFNSAVALYQ